MHEGEHLRKIVKLSPLGVNDFAEKIGIARTSLYHHFTKEKLDEFIKIKAANAFGLTEQALFNDNIDISDIVRLFEPKEEEQSRYTKSIGTYAASVGKKSEERRQIIMDYAAPTWLVPVYAQNDCVAS